MSVLVPSATPDYFARPLNEKDLEKSRFVYNALPDDAEQPPVAEEHIKNLAELFLRHNAQHVFGIHLVHGHFPIPEKTVMLGTNFENPQGRWARAMDISNIDLSAIHGHIFVLKNNELIAYEYQDGPLPDLSGVGQNFVKEFVEYITSNGLTDLFGLQVLMDGFECNMAELVLEQGTVMMDMSKLNGVKPTRVTGWQFELSNGQPRTRESNETHASMTSGNHKVYNAGKPLPKLKTVQELKDALTEVGII